MKKDCGIELMRFYRILFKKLRSRVIRTDIKKGYGYMIYLVLGPEGFGYRYYSNPILRDKDGELMLDKNGKFKRDKTKLNPLGNTDYFGYVNTACNELKKHQKELNKYLKPDERKKLRLWLKVSEKYVKANNISNKKREIFVIKLNEQFNKKTEKIIEEAKELLKGYICLEEL